MDCIGRGFSSGDMSECVRYWVPPDGVYIGMTPGESWFCLLSLSGGRLPRGRVCRAGKERFSKRKWKKTSRGYHEFVFE